ncbi:MAG: hydrolase [Candidatus Hydrogenedentota bacterium]|nr:MAG: hydrolase [Candidatus Hydrogenedentota bacterium]
MTQSSHQKRRLDRTESAPVVEQAVRWEEIDIAKRHPSILKKNSAVFLAVDLQEKLLPTMERRFEIVTRCRLLVEALRILEIPLLWTEQYPKGLGRTDPRTGIDRETDSIFEKTSFSAIGSLNLMERLKESKRSQIILCGIEAHVCVAQTALDLSSAGFQVTLCCDAVSSRRKIDRTTALRRLEHSGIVLSTVEAVLFELLERAGTEEFKKILRLVK